MACQLGAPTKEVFHNRPGHLITFQTEFRLWGVAMLGNPYGDDLFALHLKATSTYQYSPFPCFLSVSKKSYNLLSICFGLQYKTNPSTQQFIVPAQPQAHTDNTNSQLGHVRWHAIGPTMTRIFIWFLSKDCFVTFG